MAHFEHKRYPFIRKFVLGRLPLLERGKPRVFKALLDNTGLPERTASKLLQNGFVPTIKVKPLTALYGWTPATGDEVHIDDLLAADIEDLVHPDTTVGVYNYYTVRDKVELLLEVTIVHELVHFGRRLLVGTPRSNRDRAREELLARQFEKDAYGVRHTVASLGLDAWIRDPADH